MLSIENNVSYLATCRREQIGFLLYSLIAGVEFDVRKEGLTNR